MTVAVTWQLSVLCKLLSRRLLEHWKVNSSPLEYFSLHIFPSVIWLQPNVSFYFSITVSGFFIICSHSLPNYFCHSLLSTAAKEHYTSMFIKIQFSNSNSQSYRQCPSKILPNFQPKLIVKKDLCNYFVSSPKAIYG